MKNLILIFMLAIGTFAIAEQPGLVEYRANKGDSSLLEHRDQSNVTNGQAAYYEYLYTKKSSEALIKKEILQVKK